MSSRTSKRCNHTCVIESIVPYMEVSLWRLAVFIQSACTVCRKYKCCTVMTLQIFLTQAVQLNRKRSWPAWIFCDSGNIFPKIVLHFQFGLFLYVIIFCRTLCYPNCIFCTCGRQLLRTQLRASQEPLQSKSVW